VDAVTDGSVHEVPKVGAIVEAGLAVHPSQHNIETTVHTAEPTVAEHVLKQSLKTSAAPIT
jgi:hypothetical protein